MVKIYLKNPRFKYALSSDEVLMFMKELSRVTSGPSSKGLYEGVGPDCSIIIQPTPRPRRPSPRRIPRPVKQKEYQIYGQTVLHDPKTNKSWQFYLGYILLDTLYSSGTPSRVRRTP